MLALPAFDEFKCQIVEQDVRHDLALLRIVGKVVGAEVRAEVPGVPAKLRADRPKDGERVAVSGYPFNEPNLLTTSGAIASAWGTDIQEVQVPGAPDGWTFPDVADSYIADVTVNGGNSGGPVYDLDTASVLGVCVALRKAWAEEGAARWWYSSGLSIMVPMRYGVQLLSRHVNPSA